MGERWCCRTDKQLQDDIGQDKWGNIDATEQTSNYKRVQDRTEQMGERWCQRTEKQLEEGIGQRTDMQLQEGIGQDKWGTVVLENRQVTKREYRTGQMGERWFQRIDKQLQEGIRQDRTNGGMLVTGGYFVRSRFIIRRRVFVFIKQNNLMQTQIMFALNYVTSLNCPILSNIILYCKSCDATCYIV